MQVFVRDNDINSALRVLKKKMQREGTFRDMKRRRAYEKPSERRVREKAEAIRRHRKMLRKRLERGGYSSDIRLRRHERAQERRDAGTQIYGWTDRPLLTRSEPGAYGPGEL